MSLARVWRRQLYGASSVALIVPAAMLAALLVLALGGGFSSVGVLGQIFAGPPAPAGSGAFPGARAGADPRADPRASGAALPAIPVTVARAAARRSVGRGPRLTGRPVVPARSSVPAPSGASRRTGGAVAPAGGVAPIVTTRAGAPAPPPPPRPAPTQVAAQPSLPSPPAPRPTPVDTAVKVVTSVTRQVPAPAGPVVTQAVQSAGNTADGLLPHSPSGALP